MKCRNKFISKRFLIFQVLIFYVGIFYYSGQTYDSVNFTTKQGLITDEIYNFYQDSKGYVNIFTKIGAQRTNGIQFKNYIHNLPLEESFIFAMSENTRGIKYFSNSNANFYYLRNDSAILITELKKMSEELRNSVSEVYNIIFKDSSTFYVIAKGNTYVVRQKQNKYSYQNLSFTNQFDSVLIKLIEVNGNIIPIQNRFLNDDYILKRTNPQMYLMSIDKQLYKLPPLPYYYSMRNFKFFGKNKILFTYANNLCTISNSQEIGYVKLKNIVLTTQIDSDKNLWVGCLNNGLFKLDSNFKTVDHFLDHTTINSILMDANENLYCSTNNSGIYKFNLHTLNERLHSFSSNVVFIKVINGKTFIALEDGSIYIKEDKHYIKLKDQDGAVPLELFIDGNKIYLTTSSNVEIYSADFKKLLNKRQSEKIYAVFHHGEDSLIYLWRRGYKLYFKDKLIRQVDFQVKINSSIYVNRQLYLATSDGVYKLKVDFGKNLIPTSESLVPERIKLRKTQILDSTLFGNVNLVKQNSAQVLFFLKQNGILYKYSLLDNNLIQIEFNVPAEIINDFDFSDSSKLFVATNKGLFYKCLYGKKNESRKVFEGEVKVLTYSNKSILFNSRNVLQQFNTAIKNSKKIKKYFNIESINVDGRNFEGTTNRIDLHSNSLVKIKFEIINNSSLENQEYFYTIKSTKIDSGFIRDDLFVLSHLDPGVHDLFVYARYENGDLEPIHIILNVIPRFYETFIFKIVFFLFLFFMLLGLIRLVLIVSKKRARIKLQNEQMLLEYKLIALKAQINPHFMSNCLAAIQSLVIAKKTEEANFYIAQFGLLVRRILLYSTKKLIRLKDELELTELYMELEKFRFNNKFRFMVEFEESIHLDQLLIPPLLLNPIIENAVWHGISPVIEDRECCIRIRIEVTDDSLIISIEDNGVGIEFASKNRNHLQKDTNSKGLYITEQRLINLNYLINSQKSIISKYSLSVNQSNQIGTQAIFVLPLKYSESYVNASNTE